MRMLFLYYEVHYYFMISTLHVFIDIEVQSKHISKRENVFCLYWVILGKKTRKSTFL